MSAEKFYKVIAVLAAITAIVWISVYYVSDRAGSEPEPATVSTPDAEQARREQLLQSLRATEPTSLTAAERADLLKDLKSSKPTKLTDADREKLLESLKAQ